MPDGSGHDGGDRTVDAHAREHHEAPLVEGDNVTATAHRGVPAPVDELIGRETELAEVDGLIATARLVTLTGAGGSGKTRLAQEAAAAAQLRFRDGACWVDLSGLEHPSMITAALAAATGVHERPERDLDDTLAEQLRDRELLVVLDNCERHVGACATMVSRLLRACPGIVVLATSRERLACSGEVAYVVPPLPVPGSAARDASDVAGVAAVRLFALRAGQARPGFRVSDDNAAAVAEICRRLDGIPLAIELAAARTRVLAPEQIADGLSDRFELLTDGGRDVAARQRTLEASVAWSYTMLDEAEQLTLARLSVFVGDVDLEAATAVVAGGSIVRDRVLDLLSSLVDRSLVQVTEHHGTARYRLLQTIRVYARQRLTERDDPASVRDRHVDYHVALATRAQESLRGPDPGPWVERLDAALGDLRAAMDWAVAAHRPSAVVDIAAAAFDFWMIRGLYVEMRRRLVAATASPAADDTDRARGLTTASILAMMGGDHPAGHALADEAVPLVRDAGDPAVLARTLSFRAWCGLHAGRGTTDQLQADIAEAVALAAEIDDDPETRLGALMFTGTIEMILGSFEAGRQRLEHAIAEMEEAGLAYLLVIARTFLSSLLASAAGELAEARTQASQALEVGRAIGLQSFVAVALMVIGTADTLAGDERGARRHLEEALAVARHGGLPTDEMVVLGAVARAEYRFGTLTAARRAAETARQAARDNGSCLEEVEAEVLLGTLALCEDRHREASAHFELARAWAAEPRTPGSLGRALLGLAHAQLAAGGVEPAWEQAHAALEVLADAGDAVGTIDAVEAVAGIAVTLGQPQRALRLLAAADRSRTETGIWRFPLEAQRYERYVAAVSDRLSAHEADACRTDGAAMTLADAVAFARRGRGARRRPATGWSSLTPAEREVVRLVAQGCSNADISARLFVSVNTVKTHLRHVYEKLEVTGRSELVAQAANREV